jgi:hypothetical protein
MEDEPTPTPCVVTCHTEGCPLAEIPRTIGLIRNAAEPFFQVQCSPCGQMITDVVPVS